MSAATVTILKSWTEGGTTGKELTVHRVKVVTSGSGEGGAASPLDASDFGLKEVVEVGSFLNSDDGTIVPTATDDDGDVVYFSDVDNATAASQGATADLTSKTCYGIIKGYPKTSHIA